jgi:hypothetical protein
MIKAKNLPFSVGDGQFALMTIWTPANVARAERVQLLKDGSCPKQTLSEESEILFEQFDSSFEARLVIGAKTSIQVRPPYCLSVEVKYEADRSE